MVGLALILKIKTSFKKISQPIMHELSTHFIQGSHRLEKYLNLEGFLEKSLKINMP